MYSNDSRLQLEPLKRKNAFGDSLRCKRAKTENYDENGFTFLFEHPFLNLCDNYNPTYSSQKLEVEIIEEPIPGLLLPLLQPLPIPPEEKEKFHVMVQNEHEQVSAQYGAGLECDPLASLLEAHTFTQQDFSQNTAVDSIPPTVKIEKKERKDGRKMKVTKSKRGKQGGHTKKQEGRKKKRKKKSKIKNYTYSLEEKKALQHLRDPGTDVKLPDDEVDAELSRLVGYRTKRILIPNIPGKKPRLKARWSLFCYHCEKVFYARPTPKNSRYVVNHQCSSDNNCRKQYILGVKGRKCCLDHTTPCIVKIH